jgi:hypothetical protein
MSTRVKVAMTSKLLKSKKDLLRFVRVLYKILYPQDRHRIGSCGLIELFVPHADGEYEGRENVAERIWISNTIQISTLHTSA